MPSTPSRHPPLSLEQQLAQLKAENIRLEEERNSFSRIATSSLRALRREIDRPSGFWIREEEEETMLELERVSDVGEVAFHGGNWRWWTVNPAPISSPTFDMDVPLRVSIPSEIFEAIGSFADLPTRCILSRIDLTRLATCSPMAYPYFGFVDRRSFETFLHQGLHLRPLSSRLQPGLSLRNVRTLVVSANLLETLFLSDESLDAMDSFGPPLQLKSLTILLESQEDEDHHNLISGPVFDPNFFFLAFLDPCFLHFAHPFSFVALDPPRGHDHEGWSVLLNLDAASVISRWTRLRFVHFHDVDVHCTQDSSRAESPSKAFFFLDLDHSDDSQASSIQPISVWWHCPKHALEECAERGDLRFALADPVPFLLSRGTSSHPRIERAFIVISDEKKRQRQEELLETYTEERRGPFQIVSSSEAAASLGR